METGFEETTSVPPESSSFSSNNGNDAGDFECNICFELAQDPIVTLCGHLFCWPCLYRWLHHHSHSHECPVCKAIIQEEKLVPLYGRGKTQADPRSKSYPGVDIPSRPSGQRPETAPPPDANALPNFGFGMAGGFMPPAPTRFQGFPDATVYGTTSGFPYGVHGFHGYHTRRFPPATTRGQHADNVLKNLLFLIGFLVVLALLWW
ncbi:RING ZINC FINGER PROTEIN-RELATED [Salix purpurea]|uniref:E3 ubiquitin-protein ligase RMA n=1 Tax=Salix purpurea TaxID=77065 RepID=A0A9Q1AKB0_SALPP|nr:RING ZINC FINGER PROTEIN-RELATED [Salix purpurea]